MVTIVECGNCQFWGWHELFFMRVFFFYFSCVRGTKTFLLLLRGKILQCSPYLSKIHASRVYYSIASATAPVVKGRCWCSSGIGGRQKNLSRCVSQLQNHGTGIRVMPSRTSQSVMNTVGFTIFPYIVALVTKRMYQVVRRNTPATASSRQPQTTNKRTMAVS